MTPLCGDSESPAWLAASPSCWPSHRSRPRYSKGAKGTLSIIYLSKVAYSGSGEKRKKFYLVGTDAAGGLSGHLAKDMYSDCSDPSKYDGTIHDFSSKNIENTTKVDFSHKSYKGKVLLVVNTASFWGHTPQYYTLNALTEKYADKPFKILGFPCNQFGFQVRENTFSTQMSLSHLSFILSGAWGKRHRDLQQFEIRQTRRWLSS